jgi:TRAP-type mannitol/chloroaromatic compound transport system substrate-binding protein
MDRRNFVRNLAVGGAATAATTAATAQSDNLPTVKWRVQNSYPKSLGEIYELQQEVMDAIGQMTAGKFTCQFFQANELVPVPGMINAVGNGTIEAAYSASLFYIGINKAFAFGTGVPFGLNARLQYAWLRFGGGSELLDKELYSQYGVMHIPSSNTGCQMGGWFRKEIKGLKDLEGLKMRVAGLGGEILTAMGVIPQMIPPSDIYTSLEKGTIDAAEYAIPVGDEKTNLQRVTKYYYTQGFWDYSNQLCFFVNRDHWKKLPEGYRKAFMASTGAYNADGLAYADAFNMPALQRIIASGIQVKAMPQDVIKRGYEVAMDFYAAESARNPIFKTIHDHYMKFRDDAYRWYSLNETPMDVFVGNAVARSRKR